MAEKSKYKVYINRQNYFVWASNAEYAIKLARQRALKKFGKCTVTDLFVKNQRSGRWERVQLLKGLFIQ